MEQGRSVMLRWAGDGFALGLLFPAAELIITVVAAGDRSIPQTLADQPITIVVVLAPLVLGFAGAIVGAGRVQLAKLQSQTEDLAERVAHEWTAEIHDNNVAVATAASLRTKFFAALSHDMRTPLSAIIGFAELGKDPEASHDPETVHQFLAEIGTCADQLLEIVNDLMDAAKLDAGKVELQVTDADGDEIAAPGRRAHETPGR
ncbi:MAG: sensor histidine kinase [Acidimicrobiia bacterium]